MAMQSPTRWTFLPFFATGVGTKPMALTTLSHAEAALNVEQHLGYVGAIVAQRDLPFRLGLLHQLVVRRAQQLLKADKVLQVSQGVYPPLRFVNLLFICFFIILPLLIIVNYIVKIMAFSDVCRVKCPALRGKNMQNQTRG